MKASLIKGLEGPALDDLKGSFVASLLLRQRLIVLLGERKVKSFDASNKKGLYDSPNWAFQQADSRGYERALEDIIELIK